jgi:hypothetical protein
VARCCGVTHDGRLVRLAHDLTQRRQDAEVLCRKPSKGKINHEAHEVKAKADSASNPATGNLHVLHELHGVMGLFVFICSWNELPALIFSLLDFSPRLGVSAPGLPARDEKQGAGVYNRALSVTISIWKIPCP